MKNGTFIPVTRVQSSPDVKSDGKARFDTGKPTLTQGLPAKPAEPSKRDLILAHCRKRIDQGQTFDGKETAEALNLSPKTVGNILGQLRKEGLLPAFDKHSPRKTTRKKPPQPERRKKP